MASLDIVVVNYKTPADLRRFCTSLIAHPPRRHQWTVSLVNVCPKQDDDTEARAWLDRLELTEAGFAKLVTYESNVGYAVACNFGAKMGSSEFVALFNADVALTPNALDDCIDALVANPDWGVLGPRQMDDRGRLTHAGIMGSEDRPALRAWLFADSEQFHDTQEAVSVSGSAYFARRQAWEALTDCPHFQQVAPGAQGAFLPTRFYYEETFCSYHARAHGWKVVYLGRVGIVHNWHGAVRANEAQRWADGEMEVSRVLFRAACDAHGIIHD